MPSRQLALLFVVACWHQTSQPVSKSQHILFGSREATAATTTTNDDDDDENDVIS